MKTLLSALGMLLGVLLCAGGVAAFLVTGFDPLRGGLGLGAAAAGGALAWACQRMDKRARGLGNEAQRSQPPVPQSTKQKSNETAKMNRRI